MLARVGRIGKQEQGNLLLLDMRARVTRPAPCRNLSKTLGFSQGSLRTKQTIEKFKAVPVQPGTTSPLLVYFGTLLTRGKLNAFESVELSRLVLSQNKKHLLDNWFKARLRPLPAERVLST